MSAHATATFYYTGALEEDDTIFDQCTAEPHTIVFEKGQVMMPIEQALREMQPGEIRDVRIEPKQAYGTWSGKNVESVLITDIPNGENLPVGEYINWRSPASEHPIPVKVLSVRNGIAKFDFNHPLADKTLIYHIEALDGTAVGGFAQSPTAALRCRQQSAAPLNTKMGALKTPKRTTPWECNHYF